MQWFGDMAGCVTGGGGSVCKTAGEKLQSVILAISIVAILLQSQMETNVEQSSKKEKEIA
jgi:hypothetical protein